MNKSSRQPGRPLRILFQELARGTILKARAQSARAKTGGGARDIRLRPDAEVRPFMERMFPGQRIHTRPSREGGPSEEIAVRLGTATWGDGRDEVELEYWPPTNVRPREGRIGRINSVPPLADPPGEAAGTIILFVQDDADLIWVRYATAEEWGRSVPEARDRIRACLARSPEGHLATGYIDLTEGGLGIWCRDDPLEDAV